MNFYISMIFWGITLVIAALMWIFFDRKREEDYSKKLEAKKEELIGVINDAEQMIEEMNRFSDYVVSQMDAKSSELSLTPDRLEKKLGGAERERVMEAPAAEAEALDTDIGRECAAKAEPAEIGEIREPAAVQQNPGPRTGHHVISLSGRHREVLQMHDRGMDETEIARELNVGKGEIQLILELNR